MTDDTFLPRRALMAGGLSGLAGAALAGGAAAADGADALEDIRFVHVYTATVLVGPMQVLGPHHGGVQRLIPILGGRFHGPRISGEVLAGGADWNLARNDGATSVEASYFMRTDDRVTFRIVNDGVNPATPIPGRPRFTHPVFDVPAGPHDWLNKGMFVGTLRPGVGQVVIGVYQLV